LIASTSNVDIQKGHFICWDAESKLTPASQLGHLNSITAIKNYPPYGLGLAQSEQKRPVFSTPQAHFQFPVAGLGVAQSEQKRPVLATPQAHVQLPSATGAGLGAAHSLQKRPVFDAVPQEHVQVFALATGAAATGAGGGVAA
jgi:hypothetical protein